MLAPSSRGGSEVFENVIVPTESGSRARIAAAKSVAATEGG